MSKNNPLTSYLRHWLALQFTKFATGLDLPEEGLSSAVGYLVEAVVLLLGWVVVKYLGPFIKNNFPGDDDSSGHNKVSKLSVALMCVSTLSVALSTAPAVPAAPARFAPAACADPAPLSAPTCATPYFVDSGERG